MQSKGFWSYAGQDNEHLAGALTTLRQRLEGEISMLLGHNVEIFQDLQELRTGDRWAERLQEQLGQAAFLIPVLTPRYFESEWCRKETLTFIEIAEQEGRVPLVFPIRFVDYAFDSRSLLQKALEPYQYKDFSQWRFETEGPRARLEHGFAHDLKERFNFVKPNASDRQIARVAMPSARATSMRKAMQDTGVSVEPQANPRRAPAKLALKSPPKEQTLSTSLRIKVIGVGGAGGNALDAMIEKGLAGVDFVAVNTDATALQQSQAETRLQIGLKVTEGLGAGARAVVGAASAEEAIEEIVDQLAGAHMCFIAAGMGGGTGSGAAPIVGQAARELGLLCVAVVTTPFQFEGAKRVKQGNDAIEALKKVCDTVIVIPNQKLFSIVDSKTTFSRAFEKSDEVLFQTVKALSGLLTSPGGTNVDFADLRRLFDSGAHATVGFGISSGEGAARKAIKTAFQHPLLDRDILSGARHLLVCVTFCRPLDAFQLLGISGQLIEESEGAPEVKLGMWVDDSLDEQLHVTIIAI